jgi:hypothetical protein
MMGVSLCDTYIGAEDPHTLSRESKRMFEKGQAIRDRVVNAASLCWIAVCCVWFARLTLSYGPTDDPDPEGYVTYALHLQAGGGLLEWRRLPGYPALIAVVDAIGPGSLHIDVFHFQIALGVLFVGATALAVWRYLGRLTACAYAALLGGPGYFGSQARVMVADFVAALFFYGILLALICFLQAKKPRIKLLWATLFVVFLVLGELIHPSTDKRVAIFAIAVFLSALATPLVKKAHPFGSLKRVSVICLVVIAAGWTSYHFVYSLFEVKVPMRKFDMDALHKSNSNLYTAWTLYRMLLCLPPARDTGLDREIEEVKRGIAREQGYPVEAATPIAFASQFGKLGYERSIPLDLWHARLASNPLMLGKCMASEIKGRYHHVLGNLLPFNRQTEYLARPRPPQDGSTRARLYWSTGIDIPEHTLNTRSIPSLAFREIARCVVSVVLLVLGFVLIERRLPFWGMIFGLWALGWLFALLTVQTLETRYFVPLLPVIALGHALIAQSAIRIVSYGTLKALHRVTGRAPSGH